MYLDLQTFSGHSAFMYPQRTVLSRPVLQEFATVSYVDSL